MEINGWVYAALKATGAYMEREILDMEFMFTQNETRWWIYKRGSDCFQLMKEINGRGVPVIIGSLSSVLRKYLSMAP